MEVFDAVPQMASQNKLFFLNGLLRSGNFTNLDHKL